MNAMRFAFCFSSLKTKKTPARMPVLPRGFSLVEVMCAILILGIALVGLTQGITTALSSSKESELQTTAVLLAAGRIEKLRAEGEIEDGLSDGDWGDDFPNYQWKQTITSTDIKGLHDVDVIVESALPSAARQVVPDRDAHEFVLIHEGRLRTRRRRQEVEAAGRRLQNRHPRHARARGAAWSDAGRPPGMPSAR